MTSIKKSSSYKSSLTSLKKLNKQVKVVFKKTEIKSLINLKKEYKSIFSKKKSVKYRINSLLEVLVLSTAYLERLTAIKSDLLILTKNVTKLINKNSMYIKEQRSFNTLSKKDQDSLIEIELYEFNDVYEDIDYKVVVVENNIAFIDKLQFALKTCLSTLKVDKEYTNGS